MNCKEIQIDGVKFVPVETSGEKMRIIICDNRGLTFVGRADISGDSEWITIKNARCIIRWGTTKHLAEIVDRPTANTKLGAMHDVTVRRDGIIAVYDCGGGWNE